jgi:hypothetical protein
MAKIRGILENKRQLGNIKTHKVSNHKATALRYGSEMWILNKRGIQHLEAEQIKFLR